MGKGFTKQKEYQSNIKTFFFKDFFDVDPF